MKLGEAINVSFGDCVWTISRIDGLVTIACFEFGARIKPKFHMECEFKELGNVVQKLHKEKEPFVVLDSTIIGLVGREPIIIPGTSQDEWVESVAQHISYDLFLSARSATIQKLISEYSQHLNCISRLEGLQTVLPRCIDWSDMDRDGVLVDVCSSHCDLYLFNESRILSYFRFPIGDLRGEELSERLSAFIISWWGDLVPVQKLQQVYCRSNQIMHPFA